MLTTYDRLMRQYRLEARLSYRELDRRPQDDVLSWTRDRAKDAQAKRQAVKDSLRGTEGM
jgi:hypothetical protein